MKTQSVKSEECSANSLSVSWQKNLSPNKIKSLDSWALATAGEFPYSFAIVVVVVAVVVVLAVVLDSRRAPGEETKYGVSRS